MSDDSKKFKEPRRAHNNVLGGSGGSLADKNGLRPFLKSVPEKSLQQSYRDFSGTSFNITDLEKEILEFWQEKKIFKQSVEKPAGKNPKKAKGKKFVFFDGPPFATGLPHYGHIAGSILKDAVPRYWTMKGYQVERRWGWDCHGLPIENEIEKKLGLKTKKEIEALGIEKFNEAARGAIFEYRDEWKKIIPRLGRWVDMENDYKTMDVSFMESVWWVFKQLWDKGLIYKDYRSMHICARCETTLSQQEVTEGYKNIKDISATVKFELNDEPGIFVLAWTTTPWTLIGNVALAIGEEIDYVKITVAKQLPAGFFKNEFYILAKSRLKEILKNEPCEIIKEFKGKDLIGKKYKPLFDYYVGKEIQNKENGWKIYPADFVTTEEGTGIVHIAPAFGEDDFNLMKRYSLPFIQHVGMDGIIKSEARAFVNMNVKPAGDHQKTDIEIIKNLAGRGLLFSKEKYEHSYPHCWRCETPLINYAAFSWFVSILKIKKKAIQLARGINWSPAHIKEGRFGKWLTGARDWSISRQRFWASAIPIWECDKCDAMKVMGSVDDLKNNIKKSGNQYFAMRHGEAENNIKNILNGDINKNHFHLTEMGKKQVSIAAQKLKKLLKIDLIVCSDFLRAKETAKIMAENLKIDKDRIIFDQRLREINFGVFNGKPIEEYHNYFSSLKDRFFKNPPEGENFTQLKNRASEFLYEIEKKYSNKNILIVSHEAPIWLMFAGSVGADVDGALKITEKKEEAFIKKGEMLKLDFVPLPHNQNFELDLHRPYIDRIEFDCSKSQKNERCNGKMKRVSDVLDTWFDSGSMPYAQAHYPFENKKEFDKNFPANFIAEGIDQTRAWFYYLHCIAAAIKNSRAFDNVIVNGIVLAEDGQKMSKRLKNYPDPMHIVDKYGADALRLYLLSSPVVRAEDLNFSERGVDEIYKKTILRLWNTLQFYNLYKNEKSSIIGKLNFKKLDILDQWIIARLNQLIKEITNSMEKYEIDKAVRPIEEFVDDLSTWYIRRSRERFKIGGKDKKNAIATTHFVLQEFSKVIAPFAPFMADAIWKNLGNINSVHLTEWPKFDKKLIDKKNLAAMAETRKICSLGLEARQKAGIKVRQPLASIKIKNIKSVIKNRKESLDLIKDELNIKKIIFEKNLVVDVELNTEITPELKAEGQLRELMRAIQDLRKKSNLQPKDKIKLAIGTDAAGKKLINNSAKEIEKAINVIEIKFLDNNGESIKIDELEFKISLKVTK